MNKRYLHKTAAVNVEAEESFDTNKDLNIENPADLKMIEVEVFEDYH